MNLTLVMRFVPRHQDDCFADGAFFARGADISLKIGRLECCDVVLEIDEGFLQRSSNRTKVWHIAVGWRAPARVGGDECFILWLAAKELGVEVAIVRRGAVHQLPGDVCPAGTRSPAKNLS